MTDTKLTSVSLLRLDSLGIAVTNLAAMAARAGMTRAVEPAGTAARCNSETKGTWGKRRCGEDNAGTEQNVRRNEWVIVS